MEKRARWDVQFSCSSCGAEQTVRLEGGSMERDYVESFAELVVGRSRFFVKPIEPDEPGPCGRCNTCGVRAISFAILPEAVQ